jgi:hypothetical protein
MKHIFYLLAVLGGITFLPAACYDDEGSYDYQDINEIVIDTVGFKTTYTAEVAGQLVIDPKITFTRSDVVEEDLSYEWYFYSTGVLVRDDWYPISCEKKLDIPMIYNAGVYNATLYVTDKKQNITSHMTFTVDLISKISHGMLVFHTATGECDFDYIATPNTVRELEENFRIRDVFATMNGRKLRGNPLIVRHSGVDGRAVNSIYVSTDQELLRLYARNFILDHETEDLLVPPLPPRMHFEYIDGQGATGANPVFFINDGVLRRVAYGTQWYTDHLIPTPQAPGPALSGEVSLAPFSLRPTTSGSIIANSTFYDAAGKRFIYLASAGTLEPFPAQLPTGLFDVNNIGKDVLFLERGNLFYAYGVFTGGPGDYWLYELNLPKAYSLTNAAIAELAYGKHDMSALPNISEAVGFDVGTKGHVLIYADKRNIYACDYHGADPATTARVEPVTATRVNDDFPAGEEITGIKIYKFDGGIYPQGGGSTSDPSYIYYAALNGSLLYVSTWDGTQGRLYEFGFSPVDGRLENKTPLNVFDGFGRIVDMGVKIQYRESY